MPSPTDMPTDSPTEVSECAESRRLFRSALGRILRLASRPTREGDAAEYERCRQIILDLDDGKTPAPYRSNYARDRLRGADGD